MLRTIVLGGGISGQLVKLARPEALVIDSKPESKGLTRDYGANYLWEPLPGILSKPFRVVTHVDGQPGTLDSIRRYKHKIGKPEDDGNWGLQFEPESVGYEILEYPNLDTEHGVKVVAIDLSTRKVTLQRTTEDGTAVDYCDTVDQIVSTIPLPALLSVLGWSNDYPVETIFKSMPIYVVVTPRPPDAPFPEDTMYVNYLSDPLVECYRYCDRFGERHFEGLTSMGKIPTKKLYPGKIKWHPHIPEIWNRLDSVGIKCFGRYACWNPDELLHETYQNIERWVSGGGRT